MGEFGSTSELLRGRYGKTSDTPTASPVNVSPIAPGSTIAEANADRTYIILQNQGTHQVLVNLGGTPSAAAYHYCLSACGVERDGTGGEVKIENFTGQINGLATIGGASVVSIIEVNY